MTEGFRRWLKSRTLREQRLVLAALALLAFVLLWLLIIRPLGDALSNARERHAEAAEALAEARGQAALIAQLERSAPTGGLAEPVDALMSRSATEAGFPITRLERDSPASATMVLGAVRPQAFFGWVGQMEGRGLIVERLSSTTNSDQTLAVQVTMRTRGR
jgi:general secretion pathway protein M